MSRFPKVFVSIAFSFFVFSQLLAFLLVYKILAVLRKNIKNFSKSTHKLHYQLTLLLAIQLVLPLALVILPVTIRWIRILLDYEESKTVNRIRLVLISLYGIANSGKIRGDKQCKHLFSLHDPFCCTFSRAHLQHLHLSLVTPASCGYESWACCTETKEQCLDDHNTTFDKSSTYQYKEQQRGPLINMMQLSKCQSMPVF